MPGEPFTDTTPVEGALQIDRGALAALIDHPATLTEPAPDAYFVNAVLRGVTALREYRARSEPGHEPLLTVTVEKVRVETTEVDYDAWEISIAGAHGDAMLAIYRQPDEAQQMASVLAGVLMTALGERDVDLEGFDPPEALP
jgi:hypothetical protein